MMAAQYTFDLARPPVFAHENFFVSASNREAFSWVMNWPQWQSHGLVLHGPKESGKTHLARLWQEKSGAVALDPKMLGSASSAELLGNSRHALFENIDHTTPQEPLFHLLNHMRETGGSLLITCLTPPAGWPHMLPDLQSRLNALPAVAIAEPDDELLTALILKLFSDRQLRVPEGLIAYLLPRMERSFAAAAQMVERLDTASLSEQRQISLSLARKILGA